MLIAYFILVFANSQTWPVMLGPYEYEECHAVFDYLNVRHYDLSGCGLLPLPQEDAVYLTISLGETES